VTCELAHDDAAYVLGALPPAERLAFERHLGTCEECAASVRQIAGLPGLLARVPRDVVEAAPAPEPLPETLLPRLLDDVRRTERRRRWAVGLAAAAAVAVIGAGAAVVVATTGDDSALPSAGPTTAAPRSMAPVDQDAVTAAVSLTSVGWGTRLDLTCSYELTGGGYAHDEEPPTYALVVRGADGAAQQVATWKGLPGRTMHLTGATALTADQITSVEIQSADGRRLLELTG
jgi:hypothetical protein